MNISRRTLLAVAAGIPRGRPERSVVLMLDGFGMDYWNLSRVPVLKSWAKSGVFKPVSDVMPSVTNANNTSICCGCYPSEHGITGNSYLNEKTGEEEYMESAALVLAPTLFERAARRGVKSALLSSKRKTTTLLNRGADLVMTAEAPPPEWTTRLGPAPGIYTSEINHWLLKAAIHVLKTRSDIGCLYVHTTDYPMHMWVPEAAESRDHLAKLDALIGEAAAAAPDAAFLVTADHGMNGKTGCWDLERACARRDAPIRLAISAERDKYLKHHRGFGGTAWVYLRSPQDEARVAGVVSKLAGVEAVLTRRAAASRFHLMPARIGDLVVLGDRNTVFGGLSQEFATLAPGYRSHGSLHETAVPLLLHNASGSPQAGYFESNAALARWLYRG
jgi:phosphonoacetate hydrolase